MERVATDTYSFARLRENGFVYVDKTGILWPLVNGTIGYQFFVARPRRFGKSLAISTLKCLFEGRRDLFTGLAIEDKWDWSKTWPVIHLDMGSCQAATVEELWRRLATQLERNAERLNIPLRKGYTISSQFEFLISDLARSTEMGQIVLLIDEYDKPLLGHLGKSDVNEIRDAMKAFYSVIKTCESLQRFAFITGVSKFSKVSIFSDLNNLNDFSMDARTALLFGYTHDEVKKCFSELLKGLGETNGWDAEKTFTELIRWYDGYRFHEKAEPVFNPVSVGKCLSSGEMKPYWFETGTPTFLLRLLEKNPIDLTKIVVPVTMFSVYEPDAPNLMSLLYQTGYLTIQGDHWEGEEHLYHLGLPNTEVRRAFNESLSCAFSQLSEYEHASLLTQMTDALKADDVEDMLDALACFFANIPANITIRREQYYQTLFYAVFVLIGARIHAECWTNRGRVDAVVETAGGVFIFEFKLNRKGVAEGVALADAALAQIKENGYAEKYRRQGKKLTLIGAAFDAEMRNLSERRVEVM